MIMAGTEAHVALCCYRARAVLTGRCSACKWAYSCPTFESAAEVQVFYTLIPRAMRGAPLPLELWPLVVDKFVVELVETGVVKLGGVQWDQSAVRRLTAVLEPGRGSGES
jgi:hypothetical protein